MVDGDRPGLGPVMGPHGAGSVALAGAAITLVLLAADLVRAKTAGAGR
ncbi:hypothetical protein [Embleya scabrispora]|nr:hypothetical protein [Embleya scabrispora]